MTSLLDVYRTACKRQLAPLAEFHVRLWLSSNTVLLPLVTRAPTLVA